MFWTMLGLVLWVLLGGFISYYGDLQGRRWGKRRVSWLGMRPKHTAIFITCLTGGIIALGSVTTVMAIAPTVRDVVLRGERAIQDNKRLISDQKLQQIHDRQERERANEAGRLLQNANDAKLAAGQHELTRLQDEKRQLQAQLAPLKSKIDSLVNTITDLTDQQTKLKIKNTSLAADNVRAADINRDVVGQNRLLTSQNDDLKRVNSALAEAKKRLDTINSALKTSGDKQRASNDEFYKHNVDLEKQQREMERQIADMTHDRDDALELMRQKKQLATQVENLNEQISQRYKLLRTGHVILRAGVELSRLTINAHLRPEAIKRQLETVMAGASEQARMFGATDDRNGRAAVLPPHTQYTLTGYEERDENSQLDALADQWSGQDASFVVVASTLTNCLPGEPVFIDLKPYRVVKVFSKGAEVASRVIDGRASVDSIIVELMSFLQKDVKEAAIRAGTIPRIDPETGASEVGVLGTADLFRLTDRVRRMHGQLLLSAQARTDLNSADRLNLTFRVSRLPGDAQAVGAP